MGRIALLLIVLLMAACGSEAAEECPDLGAAEVRFGTGDGAAGWTPLSPHDDVLLTLGPDDHNAYVLALRVSGVDTSPTVRGLVEVNAWAALSGQPVAGYHWLATGAPSAATQPSLADVPIKTDVDVEVLVDRELTFHGEVTDGCGRLATGSVVLRSVVPGRE